MEMRPWHIQTLWLRSSVRTRHLVIYFRAGIRQKNSQMGSWRISLPPPKEKVKV